MGSGGDSRHTAIIFNVLWGVGMRTIKLEFRIVGRDEEDVKGMNAEDVLMAFVDVSDNIELDTTLYIIDDSKPTEDKK